MRPTRQTQDALFSLFSSETNGRDVVLVPATLEDMCGPSALKKATLEVVYDAV